MKKIIISMIIIFVCTIQFTYASDRDKYMLECVDNLERYGIVENPKEKWQVNDFIKRRDVFEMVYFVKQLDRECGADLGTPDELEEQLENNWVIQESGRKFSFNDIEIGSDDYYFVYKLFVNDLIVGSLDNNSLEARLDEFTTYQEALTILGRLFFKFGYLSENMILYGLYPGGNSFYDFAVDIALINSDSPIDPYCPYIATAELNDKITAYKFITLLNRALYLSAFEPGDYSSSYMYHFIDDFEH